MQSRIAIKGLRSSSHGYTICCRVRVEAIGARVPSPQASQEVASEVEKRPAVQVVQLHWLALRLFMRRRGAANGNGGARWRNLSMPSQLELHKHEQRICLAVAVGDAAVAVTAHRLQRKWQRRSRKAPRCMWCDLQWHEQRSCLRRSWCSH